MRKAYSYIYLYLFILFTLIILSLFKCINDYVLFIFIINKLTNLF